VPRILGGSTGYHHTTGTSSPAPDIGDQSDCSASLHRALIDTGAEASTTHVKSLLHKFQNIASEKYMADAGDTRHHSLGFGYLKVVKNDDNGAPNRFSIIHRWDTPTLRHTVFSPGATVKLHRKRFSCCTAYKNFSKATGHTTLHIIVAGHDLVFPGILIRTSLFNEPLVSCVTSITDDTMVPEIRYLSERATRVLWHQRLLHVHMRRLSGLHKYFDGIPAIKLPPDIEGCDTFWTCKLRNAERGTGDTRNDATVPGQGISLDFGFIVQRSKDLACYEKFLGLNGETAYLLLANHKTEKLFGIATVGKAPPLSWMNRWLTQYQPSQVPFHYACMDGGDELANNGDVQKLLAQHGYILRPTAPASYFQNDPGKRPHQDIGAGLQVMLRGANLENKFWPFAFNYSLQISNVLPHGDRGVPFERFTGQRASIKKYRTFGCLVIVKPPDKRNGKLEVKFRRSFFLGFTGNLFQIYYWDLMSQHVKRAYTVTR
jgi:hypothetical protein